MANHLSPDELAKEVGMDRQEVLRLCYQTDVPVYQGKIDKTLFKSALEARNAAAQAH